MPNNQMSMLRVNRTQTKHYVLHNGMYVNMELLTGCIKDQPYSMFKNNYFTGFLSVEILVVVKCQ